MCLAIAVRQLTADLRQVDPGTNKLFFARKCLNRKAQKGPIILELLLNISRG